MKQERCKICDNYTDAWIDEQFGIDYYYCNYCKIIFMDENSVVSSDKEIEVYNQHDNNLENKGYVKMFENFIDKAILPYYQKKNKKAENIKKALDFGCGPGPVLAVLLRQQGFEVDIYDIYFAPEKVYENKTYDLITSTEVFEHLMDPLETCKLLTKHLKEDGILAIMTLFHPESIKKFNNWWYRRDPTHISFYRPETFEVMADKLGLEVLDYDDKNTLVMKKR
ncbi:class I SAM-dependent methyltransferase [Natranaerofaba carboxydovora]|uniref:class I SAM-dependent methyltransferase n=1 Tax=Natranaerofaba carboxydovora TaxID=2742683 RepID=UPI001F12B5BF|nr:class I SAM-dependent methyltransferase [Natranaerofaba carboxydovora]UMZ72925.1 Methyltransferase domain protein [Natranaerofaba carboxydovora]